MKLPAHALVVLTSGLLVGCSAHARPDLAPPPPPPPPVTVTSVVPIPAQPAVVQRDPFQDVLDRAEREFAAGQEALKATRLVAAREHFDAAVDLLLALPAGTRQNPRIAA